jgi:hypothetical protein
MSGSTVSDPESDEVLLPMAEIIPFPVRPQPEKLVPEEVRPEVRLARALESLNAAVAEQKTALAAWRGALGALQASTSGLGQSLQRYHTSLGTLGGQVRALHDQAVTMEQWADGVLAQ